MTIRDLLDIGADGDIALSAPNHTSLSYRDLRQHVDKIGQQLASQDLHATDRVAIILPNGPLMASAFLAISSHLSAAPLNPAYTQDEYAFYLADLKPKLVIIDKNSTNPVRLAAGELGIRVVEVMTSDDMAAGVFSLFDGYAEFHPPTEAHEALVLHTSGTTSRPKIVPLLQRNILASADNIAASLELDRLDHCLNIMPLFHIHGLIGVLVASMSKGASVCCSHGFNALKFFDLARAEKVSWYSGVPTMHQSILLRAARNLDQAKALGLRLIRSSSASLPAAVFEELNAAFNCPIIEAYGMTEAAHQMTSNPLGVGRQKAGFVGIVTSPEVCILDQDGQFCAEEKEGEVCIKGDNVTSGYENNHAANASGFINNWFRTGDHGYFDKDGYLKITGRIKEIINRGGEKISPLEVDNILITHPAIQQVVTFAIKNHMLGEEIGAAVVLAEGAQLTQAEIKSFAEKSLAKFKIPRQICFLDEIPKGATGKIQRIGLAKKLGLEE